ncbi:hypothetical protein KXX52_009335, partial [Aspergillus fumigatus]
GGSRSLLLRGAMPLALATGHCRRTRDGRDSDSLADRPDPHDQHQREKGDQRRAHGAGR